MANHSKKAFTLVELLVVIAIIGLLATLSLIALQSARARARDARRVGDVKQVTTALALFYNDAGRYPTPDEWNSGSLSYSGTVYLSNIPAAPNPPDGSCDNGSNSFSYTQNEDGGSYTISFCTGGVVSSLAPGNICATPAGIAANCAGGSTCDDSTLLCGFNSCGDSGTYGGESYPTVDINGQCWLAKDLDIGTMVPDTTDQSNNEIIEKYCYDNDASNCSTYGGLYEWNEAMQYSPTEGAQGVCPAGWHLPTDAEQYALENYLKDSGQSCVATRDQGSPSWGWDCSSAGTKLKVGGSSGFNGLIPGYRIPGGGFGAKDANGLFWSSKSNGSSAWRRHLDASSMIARAYNDQAFGFSVRCIKN